jgi:L-iditol 2-dehydrogenase
VRVLRFYAPGDVRLEEAPEPRPGPGEVLVRVRACSTCGTDAKIAKVGHHRIVPPRVLGHEIAGEVVAVGEGRSRQWVDERVQVIAAIPCGRCADCVAARPTACRHQQSIGYHVDGGFAPFLVVPASVFEVGGLNRIPAGVSFAEASLAEPLSCVLNGQTWARVGPGDDVVVLGAGPVGCLHVRLARARGAARVFLADHHAERLRLAADLVGPDAAIVPADPEAGTVDSVDTSAIVDEVLALTEGRGADVVIVANASGRAQEQAVRMAAPHGRISLFGGLPPTDPIIALDANLVHYRELSVVGANGSSPAQNALALELIASGEVPVGDLITTRLPLERALEALDIVARREGIKVTVEP